MEFTKEKIEMLKSSVCKGFKDPEINLFIHACEKTGLDPFMRQIYAVRRGDSVCIQTSIDGFRLIAERTGKYAPGKDTLFEYDENKKLVSATVVVKKQTDDGTWHEVGAIAFLDEYVQKSPFWARMPRVMLSKCAESLCLRKAFPAELSGVYTEDEMPQTESISLTQLVELSGIIGDNKEVGNKFLDFCKISSLEEMLAKDFDKNKKALNDYLSKLGAKQ